LRTNALFSVTCDMFGESGDCGQSEFTDICCLSLSFASFASFADKCSCSEPRYIFVDTRQRRGA
jgi:hypothetical protein